MTTKNINNNKNKFVTIFRVLLIIVLFPMVLIYLIQKAIKSAKANKIKKKSVKVFEMSQIDSMTGIEFEVFLKKLFEKQGYQVQLTKQTGDFGADLLCKKNGRLMIVQAKCYSKTVGARAIQEIVAAKQHYLSADAVVVTNNFFSKEANILAAENKVALVDRTVLAKLISKYELHFERTDYKFSCLVPAEQQKMNTRYKFWI